jgi:alanine dehydrogenase
LIIDDGLLVGARKEVRKDEYRVALPIRAKLLTQDGHTVLLEKDAGAGSGFPDDAYAAAINMQNHKLTNDAVAHALGDLDK